MLEGRSIGSYNGPAKNDLIRTSEYGVPDLNKALYSLNNSLTLIAERTVQPFVLEGSLIKTNELHVFDLPWPEEELSSLAEQTVKLTVTLSYFVEPNPGNRYFSSKFYYQSHGLRFKMKRPLESIDEFKARINKAANNDDIETTGVTQSDNWQIGERIRNTGSIHKDIWIGTGVELASMKNIAVYPVNGWWRLRKKLKRYNESVRYSLLVTIETEALEVDLYTPVENIVSVNV